VKDDSWVAPIDMWAILDIFFFIVILQLFFKLIKVLICKT